MNDRALIGIAASLMLLASLLSAMPQASAEKIPISMTIVNTKYDTTKTVKIGSVYTYGNTVNVDVSDTQLYKIEKIFGHTRLTFSFSSHNHDASYYPWDVSIYIPVPVGRSLAVQFV